jgi:histidine triad (HIT) family protein
MSDASASPDCIFCKIVAGELPSDRVYESATTVAFKDINPAAPLHVLVVPRRHIVDASTVTADDGPLLADMVLTARAVADAAGLATPERGYRLVFNIGPDAMNSVPHLHLHVLGGQPLQGHLNAS